MDNRNYGIDLLRLLGMFQIVILHFLWHGGVLAAAVPGSPVYKLAWLLETCAYCAVNVFALITGYVTYSETARKYSVRNYVLLWLQVAAYGVAICVFFRILTPATSAMRSVVLDLFPVINNRYWYFSVYTGAYALFPLIHEGVRRMSVSFAQKFFLLLFFMFCTADAFINRFGLSGGYSVIWLSIMMAMGAILKKTEQPGAVSVPKHLCGICVLLLATWLWRLYGISLEAGKLSISKETFLSYTSPTIVLTAILLLRLFSHLKFGGVMKKLIAFSAPCAFSIYLINDNVRVREYFIKDHFAHLASGSPWMLLAYSLLLPLLFCVLGILADHVRIWAFKVLKLPQLASLIDRACTSLLAKLASVLFKTG